MANPKHYVDNELFFKEMKKWKQWILDAREVEDPDPPSTEYMAECFLKISENLAWRPNFINYTFRDDLVSDGIENCLLYAHNFNPEKSKNPFSYFTQIIHHAFIRRIQKEKKQQHVKQKMIQNFGIENMMDSMEGDDTQYQSAMLDFLHRNSREELPEDKKKTEETKK